MKDIEYLPNNEQKTTTNLALIKKAFFDGFTAGIAFCHECEMEEFGGFRREMWLEFVKRKGIKLAPKRPPRGPES